MRKLERSTEKLIKKTGLFETQKTHHAGKTTKKKVGKKKVPKLPRKGKSNKPMSWRRQTSRKSKKTENQEVQAPVIKVNEAVSAVEENKYCLLKI